MLLKSIRRRKQYKVRSIWLELYSVTYGNSPIVLHCVGNCFDAFLLFNICCWVKLSLEESLDIYRIIDGSAEIPIWVPVQDKIVGQEDLGSVTGKYDLVEKTHKEYGIQV